MILGQVVSPVWASVGDASLAGARLLLVQPIRPNGEPVGRPLAAVDRVDAGTGDRVLVLKEGGSARMLLEDETTPVQAIIVAVVDSLEMEKESQ